MKIHPLALSALLALVSVTSTDAFVVPFPRSKTTSSKGTFPTRNRFKKNKNNNNGVLKILQSVVEEASPATTRLFMLENNENNESVILDATKTIDRSIILEEDIRASSLTLAEADVLQEPTATKGEPKTTASPPQQQKQEGGLSSEMATTPESSKASSASPPPLSATTQAAGGTSLSTLAVTPGLLAGVSIGTLALGGLAVARNTLGQRQKKLDEEKQNLEEQQKRLETEAAKLQKDASQNNLFLSTIGSVIAGTVLTTGGLIEELTESTVQSLEGIGGGRSFENTIKENVKGGGFKTTSGTVVERPALSQQELPYLESKIEQAATKEQTKQQTTNALNSRRKKLSLKQNELENMTAKREATIATEEARLKKIADEEERLRVEEEISRRNMLAEKNEAARLKKEAEEVEAARVKKAEEERVRKVADEARMKKEAEEARIKKEAEEAKIKKEAEEARIKKEAEEARIQKEKKEEAERLRVLEEESKEKARQDAIAREQRALAILRQQKEELAQQQQRSTASGATAAGANVLRDYASRFNSAFISNQPPPAVDTEKLQLLLKQLGITPGIAGGVAAILVVGGGVTAIKNVVKEADENNDVAKEVRDGDSKSTNEEDVLSSQVAKLLEKKISETSQQPNTFRKTLKISVEGKEDESTAQNTQPSKSTLIPPIGGMSNTQPPPSTKFEEMAPPPGKSNMFDQQAPPSSLSDNSSRFGTPAGAKSSGLPSSKISSNPFQNKVPQSSSSGARNFGVMPPTKTNYSVGSPPKKSSSSSAGVPGSSTLSQKNASTTKTAGSQKNFGYPPKNIDGSPNKQTNSPKVTSPNQSASPFGTFVPKTGPATGFGFPPPKSSKSLDKETNSPFGTAADQSAPKKQIISPFSASEPKFAGLPVKKSISPFNASEKQSVFNREKTSPFGTTTPKTGSYGVFGSPASKLVGSPKNLESPAKTFDGSPGKQTNSPFGTAPNQASPKKQPSSAFGTFPPKRSAGAFGSPAPKPVESPNNFVPPKKTFGGLPGKQTDSPFGTAPKQGSPKKQPVSTFGTFSPKGSTSAFGSPKPTGLPNGSGSPPKKFVGLPVKQTNIPFGTAPKQVSPKKQSASAFGTFSPKGSAGAFGSPKSTGLPNGSGSPPKKFVGLPGKQTNFPFGKAPEQASLGKKKASPFGTPTLKIRSSSPIGSPSPSTVEQPGTKSVGTFPKLDAVSKKTISPFGNIWSKTTGSKPSYGSSPKQATEQNDMKRPFSPFSQPSVSRNKPKPSFSSSGPVYMPPTSKVNNAATLKNVYSSLDGKRKTSKDGGRPEKTIRELEDKDILTTSGPKNTFSPFGGTKLASKSPFSDSRSSIIPPKSSKTQIMPTKINDLNASIGISSDSASLETQGSKKTFSPNITNPGVSVPDKNPKSTSFVALPASTATTLQGKEVKKSFSPYGRKPMKRADNLPKVNPSSFSFGAPPSKSSSQGLVKPAKTSSFSFGPGEAASVSRNSPSTNDSVFSGGPGGVTPVSSSRQSSGMASASKPFAATGFPPTGENIKLDQEDENSKLQRDRLKDLGSARTRAMEEIRDEEQNE